MTVELLDTELVAEVIRKNGWTRKWVIAQLGLGQDGYKFLRGEWIPKDRDRKSQVMRDLSKLLGVGVTQLLLRLEATKRGA